MYSKQQKDKVTMGLSVMSAYPTNIISMVTWQRLVYV